MTDTAPTELAQRPIGRIGNPPALIRDVTIVDCGEPLVDVASRVAPADRILVAPAYHAMGIPSAPNAIAVRSGVLDALREAAAQLPAGVGLLLWDGLRTLDTQLDLVEDFRSSLGGQVTDEEVEQYLALPPRSEELFRAEPPPHSTGGAIDLSLCELDGTPLDLGAGFDEFEEIAWLDHFEQADDDPSSPYRARRRILYWAMVGAGFAPYPWEYWHYELGTRVAAVFHGDPIARYGPAVPWVAP
jgi:D-alanyl-D-alanine dipeptidase